MKFGIERAHPRPNRLKYLPALPTTRLERLDLGNRKALYGH